eukprot:CAMPEP_0180717644 /NCGR_PEP_ID=MMETSP1038_2-20121128/14081_1 /TAXON_ID=632150 /ORGANISM="Azadinium spinosum, Strain 3D9" /LENGTH=40 /DNA_ID= /DNA_START= /DNA_END= /DNA_ORIENTATION=
MQIALADALLHRPSGQLWQVPPMTSLKRPAVQESQDVASD